MIATITTGATATHAGMPPLWSACMSRIPTTSGPRDSTAAAPWIIRRRRNCSGGAFTMAAQ